MDYYKTLSLSKTDILPAADTIIADIDKRLIFDGISWRFDGNPHCGIIDASNLSASFLDTCSAGGLTVNEIRVSKLTDDFPIDHIAISKYGPGDYAFIVMGFGSEDVDWIWYNLNSGVSTDPNPDFLPDEPTWAYVESDVTEQARTKIVAPSIVRAGVPTREANMSVLTRLTVYMTFNKNNTLATFDDLIQAFSAQVV